MQAGQTRSCGARAHTHKHPRTEMPAVGSHATCAAALPSGSPPAPSSLSTQFRTVENCQPSNPTNFGLVFRSPRTLRVFGDLMSNISATRGRPDMRTPPRTCSPSSRHPPFTHYPFPPRSLVCGGQASPHKPRLVVSHSTCPPLSSSPHAHNFVLGTVVINTHTHMSSHIPPPPTQTALY
jgi:hypothetical protein